MDEANSLHQSLVVDEDFQNPNETEGIIESVSIVKFICPYIVF